MSHNRANAIRYMNNSGLDSNCWWIGVQLEFDHRTIVGFITAGYVAKIKSL